MTTNANLPAKASDFFNLPITGQNIVDEYCGDMRGFKATKQEDVMANCINHADALAAALESVLKTPRGSSGRIILEKEDEDEVRAALAAYRGEA